MIKNNDFLWFIKYVLLGNWFVIFNFRVKHVPSQNNYFDWVTLLI